MTSSMHKLCTKAVLVALILTSGVKRSMSEFKRSTKNLKKMSSTFNLPPFACVNKTVS